MTEKEFSQSIYDFAGILGYLVHRIYDSRRSKAGYPDLTIVGYGRVIFVELKSEKGHTTHMQDIWAEELRQCPGVEYYLWRPSDWDEIERELTRKDAHDG